MIETLEVDRKHSLFTITWSCNELPPREPVEFDRAHPLFPLTSPCNESSQREDNYGWVIPYVADVIVSNFWKRNKVPLTCSDLEILKHISNMSHVDSKRLDGFLKWFNTLEAPNVEHSKIPPQVKRVVDEVGSTYLIRIHAQIA